MRQAQRSALFKGRGMILALGVISPFLHRSIVCNSLTPSFIMRPNTFIEHIPGFIDLSAVVLLIHKRCVWTAQAAVQTALFSAQPMLEQLQLRERSR